MIVITGFFVAGEFSLVAVSRSRVESRAADDEPRARQLLARLRDLSFELSGAQLGITVTSLVVGAIAEPTVARLIEPVLHGIGVESRSVSVAIALLLATIVSMVVGELMPKNLALARPYQTAVSIGLAMAFVNRLLRPIITFFNTSADWTVRRLGIEPRHELAGLRSLQELEMIVRASSAEGEIGRRETSLLTRAIAFVEKDAADAIIPRVNVVGIPAKATVSELRQLSVETGHSRFPVFESDLDNVTGIVHVKDSFVVPATSRDAVDVSSIATPAEVVPESMRLDSLLIDLQQKGRTMAVVVDEYGGTAGIVTIEDIVEEILGEIEDEHDDAGPTETPGTLSGALHRHEVEELTGFEWPDGSYETLSGFVTAQLDRFPRPGDVVVSGHHRIEVVSVEAHIADRLAIRTVEHPERG
jgi:CBS domain containing-hemolysin-like protein